MINDDSMGVPAREAIATGKFKHDDLRESSGVAASSTQPGVLFTINDSGHEPLLFATDSTGADRGVWQVTGATNEDWEAIADGPCGNADQEPKASRVRQCLYIGDIGDNDARRSTRVVYRIPEPAVQQPASEGVTRVAERLEFRYSDGPQDVEAMFVGPTGDIFLISKRPTRDAKGQLRPARVYRLPAASWSAPPHAIAQLVDSLAIVPGTAPWRAITDAAIAPDGRYVAVRTYTQVLIFATDSTTGHILTTVAPAICNLAGLRVVGEGAAWSDAAGRLVVTSEGKAAPVYQLSCPLPQRSR
jgi:hypothetical protein